MTDSRLTETSLEVTVGDTDPAGRLTETSLEVTVGDTGPAGRLTETSLEVTVYAVPGDTRVLQQGLEVAVYDDPAPPPAPCQADPSSFPTTFLDCPAGPDGTSLTIPGYEPSPGFYVTPVCGNVDNLTAARLNNGRVVLGWREGSDYYVSVLVDALDIFRNNTVGFDQKRLAFTIPSLKRGSIWVDPDTGDLYAAVSYLTVGGAGRLECYVADDPEDPVVWTLVGVIDAQSYNGGGVQSIASQGPVYITRTGRWLLGANAWIAYGGAAPSDGSGLFSSDNKGVTWNVEVEHRNSPLQSGTTGPIGNSIGRDPNTNFLYWSHYWGPLNNQARIYESQDDGATWVQVQNDATRAWQFMVDDDAGTLYACGVAPVGTAWRAWQVVDPTDDTTFVDTGIDVINSRQGEQFQAIKLGCYLAIIDTNRVAAVEAPDFQEMYVGVIVMGDDQPGGFH